ncbi:MAG TPA: hypothetical protein VHW66_10755 [Stellaceae bacterium]|jgi:hypothetical protein|nr:hypothetical protein [Stellaceae bacterium]
MAKLGAAAGAGVAALIIVTIALCFLGEGLTLAFEAHALSPAAAYAITGAVGLVLAGLIGLAVKLMLHRRREVTVKTTVPVMNPTADAAAQLGGLVAQQLLSKTRGHPYGTAGAALAAGLAVGAIPELRDLLKGVVKH